MTEITPAEAVYFAAAALPPTERAAYLDRVCAGNDELRHRVERMLAARSEVGDFLEPEPPRASPADGAIGAFDEGRPAGGAAPLSVGGLAIPGYRIEDPQPLGSGGMGVVYRATQTALNREVALKMLLGGPFASPTLRARFLLEAESAAALEHPHIVRVFEFGEVGGYPYLAMEFVPGGTLSARLKATGPLPPADAAKLVAKLAGAVAHAHSRGVVHRDIKSPNVLLTAEGEPRLTDFGLAKVGRMARNLSVTGQVLGTPAYMPPEQAAGKVREVGTGADVYGLGAVLYDVLTGRPPFQGDSAAVTLQKVLTEEPQRPQALNPSVPRDLETICLKCLEKDPARRYGSAAEFGADLCAYLEGRPIAARPVTRAERAAKWVRRNPVVAGSLTAAALALVLGAVVSLWQGHQAREQARDANEQRRLADRRAEQARDAEAEATREAVRATRAEGEEKVRSEQLSDALGKVTRAEVAARANASELAAELKEMGRVLDLGRLREGKLGDVAPENRCIAWRLLASRLEGNLFGIAGPDGAVTAAAVSADGSRIVVGVGQRNVARVCDARTGQPLLELKGTTNGPANVVVSSVAVSADGTVIVTGSSDGTARVWDATTGTLRVTLPPHKGQVNSVAVSADGHRVVTGWINPFVQFEDSTAQVWDGTTGKFLLELKERGCRVTGVAITADGSRVVAACHNQVRPNDSSARVWDAKTGETVLELKGHPEGILGVAVSADGSRIATGAYATVSVWDGRTGRLLVELKGHIHVVRVAMSADGSRVVTGSADTKVRLWDAQSGRQLVELKGHKTQLSSVAISADGSRIVSTALAEEAARVWGGHDPLLELKGHTGGVTSAALSADGSRIVTGSADRTARVWDARTGRTLFVLEGHADKLVSVAWSADGSRIVTGSLDGTARLWDARTGRFLLQLKSGEGWCRVWCVALSADGSRVVTGSEDRRARVWDGTTGKVLFELKEHIDPVKGVAMSPDGSRVVTGSEDRRARVWDIRTSKLLLTLEVGDRVEGVAWSADGSRIVTGSWGGARVWEAATGRSLAELSGVEFNGQAAVSVAWSSSDTRIITSGGPTARVWDARTGQALIGLPGYPGGMTSVAVSADGSRMLTWSGNVMRSTDNVARLWDLRTGRQPLELNGHTDWVHTVEVSADGSRVVTGSRDHTARVWDAKTGRSLLELKGHTGEVMSVAWSLDGSRIVTGSLDGTWRVWDAKTGRSLMELRGQMKFTCVALNPDGTRVVIGSADGTARVWEVSSARPEGVAETGRSLLELKGHTEEVVSVAWSSDGSRIVTGSADGTARVWEAKTGRSLIVLTATKQMPGGERREGVWRVAVNADGSRVLTEGDDGTAVWDAAGGRSLAVLEVPRERPGSLALSADGARVVTWDQRGNTVVWDANTGKELPDAPVPPLTSCGNRSQDDGSVFVIDRNSVRQIRTRLSEDERQRRLWLTRPDPDWHIQRQKELSAEGNSYGAALHRSLEARACGILALESGDVDRAWGSFITAAALKPPIPSAAEAIPPPVLMPPAQ
jgi:WD40 repeat protein